jgi:hypothetical protein
MQHQSCLTRDYYPDLSFFRPLFVKNVYDKFLLASMESSNVIVNYLPACVHEDELVEMFKQFGKIQSIKGWRFCLRVKGPLLRFYL